MTPTPAELAAEVREALDLSNRKTIPWDKAFAALAELERLASKQPDTHRAPYDPQEHSQIPTLSIPEDA
jgi:hypothetical protein